MSDLDARPRDDSRWTRVRRRHRSRPGRRRVDRPHSTSTSSRRRSRSSRRACCRADAFGGDVVSDGRAFFAVENDALVSLGNDLVERDRRAVPFLGHAIVDADGDLLSGRTIVTRAGDVRPVDDPLSVAMPPIVHAGHVVIVSMGAEDGECAVTWLDPPGRSP